MPNRAPLIVSHRELDRTVATATWTLTGRRLDVGDSAGVRATY